MKINIQWDENLITERTHWRLLKQVNGEVMERHKNVTMKKHFEVKALRLYAAVYKPRTKAYTKRKLRIHHTQAPLVYTGHLRDVVMQTSRVTKTQYGARMYAKSYFPLTAERRAELEYVSPDEQRAMVKMIEERYRKLSHSKDYLRKRRVKISKG